MKKITFRKNKYGTNFLFNINKQDYISYNPNAGGSFFEVFAPLVGEVNERSEETALRLDGKWYILKGDFRKEIKTLTSVDEIKNFFIKKHETNGSGWSTFNY